MTFKSVKYLKTVIIRPIVDCHKWLNTVDKTMTQSEENAAEKFTLSYYVKNSKNGQHQKDFIWCLDFATIAHKEQKRKDIERTPYINHPIGVAYIISEEAEITNLDILRAALLHDTVEDTPVVSEVIHAKFGNYIGSLIEEVTDDKSLPKMERKDQQVLHARASSPQAKIVKLADKLYNLRDLLKALPIGWTEQRREEYFQWAFQVCEGLRGISPGLEEKLDDIFKIKGLISQRVQGEILYEPPPWPNHDELKPIIAAANLAAGVHKQDFMFNDEKNTPFINHAVSMALIVSRDVGLEDVDVLCAVLLHAAVGKGDSTFATLTDLFGSEVSNLIKEVTYSHAAPLEEQFKIRIEMADRLSHKAKVITLAAVIDNCRRLEVCKPEGWSLELRESYFKWSKQLSDLLINTHPQLDMELNDIWIAQGLVDFPSEFPKKAPSDIEFPR